MNSDSFKELRKEKVTLQEALEELVDNFVEKLPEGLVVGEIVITPEQVDVGGKAAALVEVTID